MPTTKETGMIDIKLRNVKVEDAKQALRCIDNFLYIYGDRRGVRNGVGYRDSLGPSFYVYRTDKTVICVGQYAVTPETER